MFSDLPKITQQSGLRLRPCPQVDGSITVWSQDMRRGGGSWVDPTIADTRQPCLGPRVMESGHGLVALGVGGPQQE